MQIRAISGPISWKKSGSGLKVDVDWRYFWYMELSRRLHSRYRLVDYIWVKSQVCEHGSDSNNSIYSSFIGLRWSNNGRNCFKSYSEHVLASHNLLFSSGSHYLLHNTRILWTQIKISVKTTFSRLLCLTVARLSKVPPSSFSQNPLICLLLLFLYHSCLYGWLRLP